MDPHNRRTTNGRAATQPNPVQEMFLTAARLHDSGRLREADQLCRQILAQDPRHADTLHLFGMIALQVGRPDAALPLLRQAVAINSRIAFYHWSLGHALHATGQAQEAVESYRKAIRLKPDFADAHSALGGVLGELGRLDEALASHRKAVVVRADHPDAHNNLANALAALHRWQDAITAYQKAIALRPAFPQAYANLAMTWMEIGEPAEAVGAWRAAITLQPDDADLHNGLGNALRETGALADAESAHRKALALRPNDPVALNDLGNALGEQERWADAVASYRAALQLQPSYKEALNNLGNALLNQDLPTEAEAALREALAIDPAFVQAHHNLATLCREQGRVAEAEAAFRAALAIQPDYVDSRYGLATLLLARGQMPEGWAAYEARWETPILRRIAKRFRQPLWQGEPALGRHLLIHAEHGFGNTLQFSRYAPIIAASGIRVTLAVQPELVRLLKQLPGIDQIVALGGPLPAFDLHIPMLSVPRALGTTLESIPNPIPLEAGAARAAELRARMGDEPGLRVGLAWAGAPSGPLPGAIRIDRRRSIAPERLAPLLDVPNVRFYSLQKSGPAANRQTIIDLMPEMTDFADTAALIANLDLVITVDTAIVHLAGAMGRKVWLLDRHDACWRWLLDRADSPWYPTLRIHRQPTPGDWSSVIEAVTRDLRALAGA